MKRSSRAGVEDRWHRSPKADETIPYPADDPGPGCWCMDHRHGIPATLVTTIRHGKGMRWLARWVDHDGQERSRAFSRKAEAQAHIAGVLTALSTGSYADPKRGKHHLCSGGRTLVRLQEWPQAQDPRRLSLSPGCHRVAALG